MARFVVLVIDSFGVGAMKDVTLVRPQDAGANTCGHILSQFAAFAATNAGEAGANQRIGLCARRYAAVRFRNLGRGRAAT
ncbi:metalloenzyme superfamily protein [Escherichia coli]|uniref:Metalloenzyme superfamily protein n=1 Tax=Escherichia coli TaxID=562 RepID=A0A2X1JEC3_ECOLX|nr:metalloenzyme superfamily protein [Escherichia coli]